MLLKSVLWEIGGVWMFSFGSLMQFLNHFCCWFTTYGRAVCQRRQHHSHWGGAIYNFSLGSRDYMSRDWDGSSHPGRRVLISVCMSLHYPRNLETFQFNCREWLFFPFSAGQQPPLDSLRTHMSDLFCWLIDVSEILWKREGCCLWLAKEYCFLCLRYCSLWRI